MSWRTLYQLSMILENILDLEQERTLLDLYDMEQKPKNVDVVKDRRSNFDIHREYLTPEQIFDKYLANFNHTPYAYDTIRKQERDKALVAALYVTGLRAGELNKITKKQVSQQGDFIEIKDIRIEKRQDNFYLDKALPLKGKLAPFTELVWNHVKTLRGNTRLFPIDRTLIHRIVRATTGQWPHYFRAQHISYLIVGLRLSTLNVARLTGHKTPNVLSIYTHSSWKDYKEELLK